MSVGERSSTGDRAEFVHGVWPAEAHELAPIRAEVHRWLRHLGLSDAMEDAVVMAVNEATTNVVDHAYPPGAVVGVVEVTFWTETGALCVEVLDHGRWRVPVGRGGLCGLGMALMQRLVPEVLIRHDARGTRVLLRHPLPAWVDGPTHGTPRSPGVPGPRRGEDEAG